MGSEDRQKKISSQPVYQEAISKLSEYIRSSDLGPGDLLPAERKLAETFQVSRHTLREAIKALQEKGLLSAKRGSGNYIAATSSANLKQLLQDHVQNKQDELADIFQFREMLEPQIAGEAARNATDKNIAELENLVKLQATCDTESLHRELDDRFHHELAVATGNRILVNMILHVRNAISPSRSEHLLKMERREISYQGHLDIFKAVKSGDTEAATEAMKEHLLAIKKNVFGN